MPNFDSGVKEYIVAEATVRVHFPVNFQDRADVSCNQCQFFRRSTQLCGLNGAVCEYPQKYVGSQCPLVPVNE